MHGVEGIGSGVGLVPAKAGISVLVGGGFGGSGALVLGRFGLTAAGLACPRQGERRSEASAHEADSRDQEQQADGPSRQLAGMPALQRKVVRAVVRVTAHVVGVGHGERCC